jgi:hypothetical protein
LQTPFWTKRLEGRTYRHVVMTRLSEGWRCGGRDPSNAGVARLRPADHPA